MTIKITDKDIEYWKSLTTNLAMDTMYAKRQLRLAKAVKELQEPKKWPKYSWQVK